MSDLRGPLHGVLRSPSWADPERERAFQSWLGRIGARHGLEPQTLAAANADASFRRYLRLRGTAGSFIVMDAPPPLEDVRPFVHVAGLIEAAGLDAPRVLECDAEHGFLLLTDLGERTLLQELRELREQRSAAPTAPTAPTTPSATDLLMREAMSLLVRWQSQVDARTLTPADAAFFEGELALFPTWRIERARGVVLSAAQRDAWVHVARLLVAHLTAQPQVAMHADWMPRNLMVRTGPGPSRLAIIDFQDAMRGPIAHDVASMLRDAFISWNEEQELDWAVRYWETARRAALPLDADFGEFWKSVEWTGLYRHLRVIGIFSRLEHRDGKASYAEDLPRFFAYCTKVAMRYRPLAPLLPVLEAAGGPALASALTF